MTGFSTVPFILQVLTSLPILLATLLLFTVRPAPPARPSPTTPAVDIVRIPRRALILSLLSLASLTHLVDGLVLVVLAVVKKYPLSIPISIASVLGILAFSGLAVVGAWKDVHGV